MDTNQLDDDIIEALEERGFDETDIKRMSTEEAFSEYCEWHGLIEWGYRLHRVHEAISKANAEAQEQREPR